MTDISVRVLDEHAAARSAAEAGGGASRATFLRRAVVAGGGIVASGVLVSGLPAVAEAQPSAAQDVRVLNFALLLEYIEAEFYTRAEASGALSGEALTFARVVGQHEREHVAFLQNVLGAAARPRPTLDFGNAVRQQGPFLATAMALEDLGVAAYNGQAPLLRKATLAAAAGIVSVEARHAAWVRDILRRRPAPVAFDTALTRAQVEAAVGRTGFVVSA
jgi:hypothetical protein